MAPTPDFRITISSFKNGEGTLIHTVVLDSCIDLVIFRARSLEDARLLAINLANVINNHTTQTASAVIEFEKEAAQ